ncbi:hypothetical protein ROJ8625_03775 [Roseivivax jejudonensis]|uniref:Uncharacterized protein n=1 Tax=Roseivivax jejudonensis TaxID=1529041 RepID=A0A1X7A6W1_9RHOB|nr:hypothetical protein [Roseivivax jejudonensis]SLN72020.1 hypothetical protein ROJ8625_03775 [Roseivivax jejudonensis]
MPVPLEYLEFSDFEAWMHIEGHGVLMNSLRNEGRVEEARRWMREEARAMEGQPGPSSI